MLKNGQNKTLPSEETEKGSWHELGPVSHGRTVLITGKQNNQMLVFVYSTIEASNRINLSVSQNLNTQ